MSVRSLILRAKSNGMDAAVRCYRFVCAALDRLMLAQSGEMEPTGLRE